MNDRRRQNEPKPDSPLFSEKAESIVVGTALQDAQFFWDCHGKIKPQYFTVPRLARIWEGMIKAVEKGRPPTPNWMPLFVNDLPNQDDPLAFYINVLMNDAREEDRSTAPMHADTVYNLANKRAVLESIDHARQKILQADFGTPPERLQDYAIKALAVSIDANQEKDIRSYEDWAEAAWKETADNYKAGEDSPGIGLTCGLRAVEDVMGRLLPGKLYILAGMSGSGKSAIVRQIIESAMESASKQAMGVGYIASLEMTGKEYAQRGLAQSMGIPFSDIERGALDGAQIDRMYDHARRLKRFNIVVDSRPGMTIDEIKARMQKLAITRGGLALAAIDHLIIIGAEKGESLFDKVTRATMKAKNLAKEMNIPILLLAQLTEKKILESGSGWPNTSHVFGGETTVQNADVVAFIHRHEMVLSKKEPSKDDQTRHDRWVKRMEDARGKAHFFSDKRRGGNRTSRELLFDGPTMSFRDL